MSTRQIAKGLTLWPTDRPDYPLAAVLSYRADDPYAVRLAFIQGSQETVSWTFGRELLAEGLYCRAGAGDVVVAPHEEVDDYLVLTVTPASGYPFALYATRQTIEAVVDAVYGLVPMGREHAHLDIDGAVARILSEVTP